MLKRNEKYVPLLPGCVATGKTPESIMTNIKEAIEFHLEGSREDADYIDPLFDTEYELIYKFDVVTFLNY